MNRAKCILILTCLISLNCVAQIHNWQNLDLQKDSVFGVSIDKAYQQLLAHKKPTKVLVAVIDTGVDTTHEDLQGILWTDPKDGSHGRNYTGYEVGKEDITNLAGHKKDFFDSLSYAHVPEAFQKEYEVSRKMVSEYSGHVSNLEGFLGELSQSEVVLNRILKKMGNSNPSLKDLENYQPSDNAEKKLLENIKSMLPQYHDFASFRYRELDKLIKLGNYHAEHGLNLQDSENAEKRVPFDNDISNDALGLVTHVNLTPMHGTHVVGILAATRGNGKGMNGVADDIEVMVLKILSNIRELRDENLADAIRYATDNGAKIINLSFGKYYTWNKKIVDAAVKYAMSKDVLIIHAAGNDGLNLDENIVYPNPYYLDGGHADAWIEVGASGAKDDSTLKAVFSNYGKIRVNVFAPGVEIYSTTPGSNYEAWAGTSMAAPLVSGIAALIREYYPKLNAIQVKAIILRSVAKVNHTVKAVGSNNKLMSVPFTDICTSGGVVNAYNALKMANSYQ